MRRFSDDTGGTWDAHSTGWETQYLPGGVNRQHIRYISVDRPSEARLGDIHITLEAASDDELRESLKLAKPETA
jgi:hypothetical protein